MRFLRRCTKTSFVLYRFYEAKSFLQNVSKTHFNSLLTSLIALFTSRSEGCCTGSLVLFSFIHQLFCSCVYTLQSFFYNSLITFTLWKVLVRRVVCLSQLDMPWLLITSHHISRNVQNLPKSEVLKISVISSLNQYSTRVEKVAYLSMRLRCTLTIKIVKTSRLITYQNTSGALCTVAIVQVHSLAKWEGRITGFSDSGEG